MKYIFYSIEFESLVDEFSCPICKTKLSVVDNVISTKCTNNCLFNTLKHIVKKKMLLPENIYNEYVKLITVSRYTVKYWTNKGFTEDEAKKQINKIQSCNAQLANESLTKNKTRTNKQKQIEKYETSNISKEDAIIFVENNYKKRSPLCVEYWINKGFSENEALNKIKNNAKIGAINLSEKRKKNPEKYNDIYTTQVAYWLKQGLSKEEAKAALKKRQTTFSLNTCIEKYGKEEGLKRFNERQVKWKNKVYDKHGSIASGLSKISQLFIESLLEKIPENQRYTAKFGKTEKCIKDIKTKKAFKYDFTFNKKIIEFNGDFWHANPRFNDKDSIINYPLKKVAAEEIWEKDNYKIELAKKHGYNIFVVWEYDYNNNKEEIINNCLKFLEI